MGKYEKKPTRHINWQQTLVDGLMSFFVGENHRLNPAAIQGETPVWYAHYIKPLSVRQSFY